MTDRIKKNLLMFFYILIIVSFGMIINILKNNIYNFEIKGLTRITEDVVVNLGLSKEINYNNTEICFDSYCKKFDSTEHLNKFSTMFDEKYVIDNTLLKLPNNINKNDIEYLYIYTGNKSYHYLNNDIKNFNSYKTTDNYEVIKLPKIDNFTGRLNQIVVLFMSLFYNYKYFLLPYILLFISILGILYLKNLKINLTSKLIIPIVILGIILRINHLTYVPLWIDELYTKYIALDSFKAMFQDPGNPPLFYILTGIFTKIFSNSDISLRLPSVIYGVLTLPFIWLIFKDISKNFALFATFMASINSVFIYRAQEARAYSLDVLLSVVAIYVLYKFIENPNTKNIILNVITTVLLINTNYYLIIIAGGNTLWGTFFAKKNKLKFFIYNSLTLLTLIPYFSISLSNALDSNFNAYITKPTFELVSVMVRYYFLNNTIATIIVLMVLGNFILYLIPKVKIKNKYYPYLFFIFNFTLITSLLISIYIKPMIHRTNIVSIYGIFFLLVISAIYPVIELKSRVLKANLIIYSVFTTFMFFNMTYPYHEKEVDNIKSYTDFISADARLNHSKGYEINAILPHVTPDIREYESLKNLDYIKWHVVVMGSDDYVIKKEKYVSKNNSILYIPLIGTEFFIPEDEQNVFYDYTDKVTNAKIVIK